MNDKPESSGFQDSSLKQLGNRMLKAWMNSAHSRTPSEPGLIICNPATPTPDYESLYELVDGPLLKFNSGQDLTTVYWREIQVVQANSGELPLQSSSIGLVMLCHVVSRGAESELAEACRVLQPGGVLLIQGLNRNGFRYLADRSDSGVPGLRPLAVRERLERLDMQVEILMAAGFLNCLWPKDMNHGLSRLLIPVADSLMIVARKEEPRLATPVKRTQLRTVSAPSALAGP